MARKQAEQFREVHKSIKFYLQLFSMISHIDGTRRYMDLKRRVEEIPGEITRRLGQIFNNASSILLDPGRRRFTRKNRRDDQRSATKSAALFAHTKSVPTTNH
jgi:hypothetical protein